MRAVLAEQKTHRLHSTLIDHLFGFFVGPAFSASRIINISMLSGDNSNSKPENIAICKMIGRHIRRPISFMRVNADDFESDFKNLPAQSATNLSAHQCRLSDSAARVCLYPEIHRWYKSQMPRNTPPKVLLALSPHASARALGISYARLLADGINTGALTVHACGAKRRILIREIEAWLKTWPVATKRKSNG